jgi:hypothetical protein
VEFDKLQPQFHIPSAEEVDFSCEFVETFIYQELTLLNDKSSDMSNDERLRSLTLILFIIVGFLRMVPRIDSEEVLDLYVVLEKEADNQKSFLFLIVNHQLLLLYSNTKLNIHSMTKNQVGKSKFNLLII